MRTSRFGGLLIGVGAAVGVAAVVGLAVGFEPATLPRAILNIAVYKLTFAAAAGLLAAGAVVQRYARRPPDVPADAATRPLAAGSERLMLSEPMPDSIGDRPHRDVASGRSVRDYSS